MNIINQDDVKALNIEPNSVLVVRATVPLASLCALRAPFFVPIIVVDDPTDVNTFTRAQLEDALARL